MTRRGRFSRSEWDVANGLLFARSGGRCEDCGVDLNVTGAQRHHRVRRAVGLDRVVNLVLLCPDSHAWVHAHPEEARARGLIVSALSDVDPADVPVVDGRGRRWLLDSEGGRTRVGP